MNAPVYVNLKGELGAKESNVMGTMFYRAATHCLEWRSLMSGAEGFALGGKQLETRQLWHS